MRVPCLTFESALVQAQFLYIVDDSNKGSGARFLQTFLSAHAHEGATQGSWQLRPERQGRRRTESQGR